MSMLKSISMTLFNNHQSIIDTNFNTQFSSWGPVLNV